ncbi:GntR family transcriptional regulator [Nonomuraea sp. NPDC050153]|uniref:GntR family transcriptional regulator n=1 Tax=Nonomuraea sp. NPDC050153 TaxID=3364359 RepID=UPI0037A9EBE2
MGAGCPVIRRRIESGEWPPGRKITESGIKDEFVIAKVTVRKVIKGLRDDGLIYTRPNLGSFIGPEPPD